MSMTGVWFTCQGKLYIEHSCDADLRSQLSFQGGNNQGSRKLYWAYRWYRTNYLLPDKLSFKGTHLKLHNSNLETPF